VEDVLAGPAIVSSDDIFQTLLKYAEHSRKGDVSETDLRWLYYPRETSRPVLATRYDYRNFLAQPDDASLAGYARRLSAQHHLSSFFLQLTDLHVYDAEVWRQVREFIVGLYQHTGLPGEKAWCDAVVGRYACTPFGVHLDGASNFAFGIEGTKTIHLWEPEFYQREMAQADPYDYRRYLSDALSLEISPGKMVYWPSRFWHVAESNGEFSAVMNIAFYINGSASEPLLEELGSQLRSRLGVAERISLLPFNQTNEMENARHAPLSLRQSFETLKRVAEGGWSEQALASLWLRRLTGLGFRRSVLLKPGNTLKSRDFVCGDSRYPILYVKLADNSLVCSANGHTLRTTSHPSVIKLIEHLNSGLATPVGDLVKSYADGFVYDSDRMRELLETFVSWHSVRSGKGRARGYGPRPKANVKKSQAPR
jgi:hypothetical protein